MDNYLKLLEKAKKQFQQYVGVSELCELVDDDEPKKTQTPSPESPSTTNEIHSSGKDQSTYNVHCQYGDFLNPLVLNRR